MEKLSRQRALRVRAWEEAQRYKHVSHSFGVGTLFKALTLRRSFKGIKPRIIASESFSKFCPSDARVSQGERGSPGRGGHWSRVTQRADGEARGKTVGPWLLSRASFLHTACHCTLYDGKGSRPLALCRVTSWQSSCGHQSSENKKAPHSRLARGDEGLPTPRPGPLVPPPASPPPPPGSQLSLMLGPALDLPCLLLFLPRPGFQVFVILYPFPVDKGSILGQTLRGFL